MNSILAAAVELQQFLESRSWRFCIIGGLAVIRWGHPRSTKDVDVSLYAGLGSEAEFIDGLLSQFPPRIDDARRFAFESRVVLVNSRNGIPFDIALAGFPFEEQVIDRASDYEFAEGCVLKTASLEDTVVLKAFAGRRQDWADVEGIVVRQAGNIQWPQVRTQLQQLCEINESLEPMSRLTEICTRFNQ
jgi:predicted nucleotidyltransferase